MKSIRRAMYTAGRLLIPAAVLLLLGGAETARAQNVQLKWLDVGDLANRYASSGSYGLAGPGMTWPQLQISSGSLHGYHDGYELWIGAKDWTDAEGTEWPYKIAYTSRGNAEEDVFLQDFKLVSKYPDTEVVVDLRPTERHGSDIDEVDPNLKADRMLLIENNTVLGVTMTKKIYAFSQQYHDDYHITEITLTNTGNVDDDAEVELPNQTVEGLYLWWDRRWGQTFQTSDIIGRSTRWGRENMHDYVRDADLRATYTWQGLVNNFSDWDPIGAPAIASSGTSFSSGQDTTGRLHAVGYAAISAVHADRSATDATDDTSQPATLWHHEANGAQATGTDDQNAEQMRAHYEEWFQAGTMDPFHAWVVEPSGDFAHPAQASTVNRGGTRVAHGYGPYTLGPGESVTIVVAEAVSGLNQASALAIGRQFKKLHLAGTPYADIAYDADGDGAIQDDERMDKNEWAIWAAQDTLLQTLRKANANYDAGYNIPQPPPPPTRFEVRSDVGGISLAWTYPYENPPGGFQIWRARNFYQGTVQEDYRYQLVATLPGDARAHKDSKEVFRGINYFYYITAVGEPNTDPTAMTPTGSPLKSSRYYTQTYAPATLLREPGATLSDARVVPNPFHVGASSSVRYPGAERIGFLDIPGQCTIKIFTERGDLVQTISHTDGTGDEFWNLQTEAQQMLVSGLYIAAVEDHATGDVRFLKFIVIR